MIGLEPLDVRHVKRLRELHEQPGVRAGWGAMEPSFPFDEPESARFAVVADGQVAGLVQHGVQDWPESPFAYVDIFLGDDFAGRGIGTEAMKLVVALAMEAHGLDRVTVDPLAANKRAIRCYEKVGFEPVAEWRNTLLMEYVKRS